MQREPLFNLPAVIVALLGVLAFIHGVRDWVQAQNWTADDLERALLGNVKDAVPAIRPAAATGEALNRHRRGETAAMRAANYRQRLDASPEVVKGTLLDYLGEVTPQGTTAVAGSRAALERANAERTAPLVIEEMLPEKV